MISQILAVGAAMLLIGGATAASSKDLGPILEAAMKDSKVAGKVVRGVRRNDGTDRVRETDVWHIGSDGKAMTATMVARLVDRGVLSWSKPPEEMLPDLAAGMRPEYRRVTLAQLLSHHSCLPENIVDEKTLETMFNETGSATLSQRRLKYVARAVQDAPVGPTENFSYSNTGLLIAAVIAQRATG